MQKYIRRNIAAIVRAKTEHIEHVISVSRSDPCNHFELVVDVLKFQVNRFVVVKITLHPSRRPV